MSFLGGRRLIVMEGPWLMEGGPAASVRWIYSSDPWGNQMALFDYKRQAFEASSLVNSYRPPVVQQ